MSDQKRLFLVDAYALIFRGYYAFIKNPRINSKGEDTSAIMGFMNSLLDVIKRERPDHLAVCFDKGGSADRVEMFEAYKANRDETPEGIKTAVPYIYKILKAMHIPIMVKEGYEADDVIGTLAKKAEKEATIKAEKEAVLAEKEALAAIEEAKAEEKKASEIKTPIIPIEDVIPEQSLEFEEELFEEVEDDFDEEKYNEYMDTYEDQYED